jgi:hypothetical protein
MPQAERVPLVVDCPGIYARTRTEVRRLSNLGDPRLILHGHLSTREKAAMSAADPMTCKLVALAQELERGETVVVSSVYGRPFREATGRAWWHVVDDIEISANDQVRPVLE